MSTQEEDQIKVEVIFKEDHEDYREQLVEECTEAAYCFIDAYQAARSAQQEQQACERELSHLLAKAKIERIVLPGNESISINTEERSGSVTLQLLRQWLGDDQAHEIWDSRPSTIRTRLRVSVPDDKKDD